MFKLIPAMLAIALAAGLSPSAQANDAAARDGGQVKNVVLVHGAFADGAGWRPVYDDLTARGYRVSIVQNPLETSGRLQPLIASFAPLDTRVPKIV